MISSNNRQSETAVPASREKRTALALSVTMAIVLAVLAIVSQILLRQHGQTLSVGPFRLVAIGSILINIWLIHHGRVMLGTGFLAAVLLGIVAFITSQLEGMLLFININATVMIIVLFTYTWPRRWLGAGVGSVIAAAMVLMLLDLYWPGSRLAMPSYLRPVYYAATGAVVLVVAGLILWQFRNYTLRGKLIVTFLVVTAVPLVVLSIGNYLGLRSALIDDANQRLETAALQTAVNLDDFFNTGISTIRAEAAIIGASYDWAYFARLTDEERGGPVGILAQEKAITLLSTYRDKDPINITSYALLDMNGQVLFQYPMLEEKTDESGRSYFTEVIKTGRHFISPVEFSPDNGEAYFHFSAIVVDNVGKQVGVLRARYKADVLQQLVARSTGLVGGQSFAVLFDENQLHLAHGTAPETLYKLVDVLSAEQIQALKLSHRLPDQPLSELSTNLPDLSQSLRNSSAIPFFAATDVATGSRINQVAVTSLNKQPWQVAFFQPQEVFLAPVQTLIRRTLLLTLFVLAGVSGAAVIVAGFIARPIIQLESVAAKVAKGDMTVQVPVLWDDEVGALAHTFNLMTAQLKDLVTNLENRVSARTRALETSAEVSRQLSLILERDKLVKTVVEQVKQAFDYYHAHIYLFDEKDENLIMVGGTGEAGQTMLAKHHQIAAGKGLVGRAGQLNQAVWVSNTSQDAGWLPNPLLPDTKAEIAVPIVFGDDVLGVLDVQHNQVDGLDEKDVELLRTIASQLAIALRNSQLYEQTQQALSEMATQATRLTHLNGIGHDLSAADDLDAIFEALSRYMGAILPHDRLNLSLLEPGDKNLEVLSIKEGRGLVMGQAIPVSGTAVEESMTKRTAINLADLSETNYTDSKTLVDLGARSVLIAPLITARGVLGTINLASDTVNAFGLQDENLLQQVASLLASTLESQRLYTEAQKQAEKERLVNIVSQKIQSTVTIESALETTMQELGKALQARYTQVELAVTGKARSGTDNSHGKSNEYKGVGR